MSGVSIKSALSSPFMASVAAVSGRFLLLGGAALTGILLPLSMTQESVGMFFLAQALIAALATVGQLGLNITAPAIMSRSFGQNDPGQAAQTVFRSLVLGGISSLIVATIFVLIIDNTRLLTMQGMPGIIGEATPIVAVSVIALALVTILTEQHRAVGNFIQASFMAAGASTASALTVLFAWLTHNPLALQQLLIAGALGSILGCIAGVSSIWKWHRLHGAAAKLKLSYRSLISQTRPNLTTTIMFLIVAQADLWIIAAFKDTSGLAIYGLASRLAALILIPLAVVNTVIAPSIGRLWARKKTRYLTRVLGVGAGAATLLAAIGYSLFLIIGKYLLVHMWSDLYIDAYYIFAILGVSQITQTIGGAAGYVLMMLGRQDVAMRISVGCGLVMIVGGAWAMSSFGIIGLAVVYSFGGVIQSVLMISFAQRIFNLKTTANYRALFKFSGNYLRKNR